MNMRYVSALLFVPLLAAQDPAVERAGPTEAVPAEVEKARIDPAAKKLQAELRQSAASVDTRFAIRFRDNGSRVVRGRRMGAEQVLDASGSFHRDLLCISIQKPRQVDLVQAGRDAIVRDAKGTWRLGRKEFDSRALPFVGDPQRLLRALSLMVLDIKNRSIGECDGSTCEFVGVSLTGDQVADLVFADLMFDGDQQTRALRDLLARRGGADAATKPVCDVAFAIDVKRRVVSRVTIRQVGVKTDMDKLRRVLGRQQEDPEEVGLGKVEKENDAKLEYEQGLPVRKLEEKHVVTLEIDFRDYGKVAAPELDPEQKRLLGR